MSLTIPQAERYSHKFGNSKTVLLFIAPHTFTVTCTNKLNCNAHTNNETSAKADEASEIMMEGEGESERESERVSVFRRDYGHQNCLIRLLDTAPVHCPIDIKDA